MAFEAAAPQAEAHAPPTQCLERQPEQPRRVPRCERRQRRGVQAHARRRRGGGCRDADAKEPCAREDEDKLRHLHLQRGKQRSSDRAAGGRVRRLRLRRGSAHVRSRSILAALKVCFEAVDGVLEAPWRRHVGFRHEHPSGWPRHHGEAARRREAERACRGRESKHEGRHGSVRRSSTERVPQLPPCERQGEKNGRSLPTPIRGKICY